MYLRIKKYAYLLISLLITAFGYAQENPFELPYYNFIHYNKNKLEFYGNTTNFEKLFKSMNKLALRGSGKISVVHIGGSHIQAGALPGKMSEKLQNFVPGLDAGRGFVFPYSIAKTNNPRNYTVDYTGSWNKCMSTNRKEDCLLGLSGIKVFTHSSDASISIIMRELSYLPNYDFTVAKIIHSTDSLSYNLKIDTAKLAQSPIVNTKLGYTELHYKEPQDTLIIELEKNNETQQQFELYGISLEHNAPGFIYHGIGLNGASIPCYLRCNLLEQHLDILNTNLVILTLGTNDAYTRKFRPEIFTANYDSLLTRIREVAPYASILMTVPNDSYIYRRYMNKNTAVVRDLLRDLAKKHNAAVWDFYGIMGELNSITLWYDGGLTSRDKIHFNRAGYFVQADLLYNAILKAYDKYNAQNGQIGETVITNAGQIK